jgi:Fic family protein
MREYEKTHRWITFSAKALNRPLPKLWEMLGECRSKCEHIAGVPLQPAVAKELHQLYLIKGIRGTAAIEGNTLSEDEVRQHLEGKLVLPPSREYLKREIENITDGLHAVWQRVYQGNPFPLAAETFEMLNGILLGGLDLEEGVVPGRIRTTSVGVLRYRGAPFEDCRYLLDRLGQWLCSEDFGCPPELAVPMAFLKAIVAHLYMAWIHAFGDGNGRTARLVEFQILCSAGVPTPAAHLLSNHYNLTRAEYYRQLDYASQSGGDIIPFVLYAVQGLLDGLQGQLQPIRSSQLQIAWEYHVYESFRSTRSTPDKRRREVVLAMSKTEKSVRTFSEVQNLSAETAAAYAGKTRMTIRRDLKTLLKMGLLLKEERGLIANKKLIEAFLPKRAEFETPRSGSPEVEK